MPSKENRFLGRGTGGDSIVNKADATDHGLTTQEPWPPSDYVAFIKAPEGSDPEDWRRQCYIQQTALDWGGDTQPSPTPFVPVRDRPGWVYFIGAEQGLIKIGFTANLQQRLTRLSASSPIHLRVLASTFASESAERSYHLRFAVHRRHGEWFERCPEILAEIDRLSLIPQV